MSYKAKIFTREEFRKVVAAAIYDYEQAPAKCLYTTKDAADQLYGHYGEEIEVENEPSTAYQPSDRAIQDLSPDPLRRQNHRGRRLQRLPVRHEPQTSQTQVREVREA